MRLGIDTVWRRIKIVYLAQHSPMIQKIAPVAPEKRRRMNEAPP
jgi:hypothetical protein